MQLNELKNYVIVMLLLHNNLAASICFLQNPSTFER